MNATAFRHETKACTSEWALPFFHADDTGSIIFQGDSITDGARQRETDYRELGRGYAMITAAHLLADRPELTIHNFGISGNRVTDPSMLA